MKKYIYKIYVDEKNNTVVKEQFPIVYESRKYIVYAVNGTPISVYKNSCYYYNEVSNELIVELFRTNSYTVCYTKVYNGEFNGKNLYKLIYTDQINKDLANFKMNMDGKYKSYLEAKEQYENKLNYYKSLGWSDENENT